jgi:hypothetical protein
VATTNSTLSKAAAEEHPGSQFAQAAPSAKWLDLCMIGALHWFGCMIGWVALNFYIRDLWVFIVPADFDRSVRLIEALAFMALTVRSARSWLLSFYVVLGFEVLIVSLRISIWIKLSLVFLVSYLLVAMLSYAVGKHWIYERTSSENDLEKVARLRKELCRELGWANLSFPIRALVLLPDTLWHLNQGLYAISDFLYTTRTGFFDRSRYLKMLSFDISLGINRPRYVKMLLFDTAVIMWGPLVVPIVLVSITPTLRRLRREKLV